MTYPATSDPSAAVASPPSSRSVWLAHPALSLLLAASWLALSHSLAPVHLLSAALLGLVVPRLLHGFLTGLHTPPVAWGPAFMLTLVVVKDIVMSNLVVAKLVLGPLSAMKPAWLTVPLDTDHPHVNGLLAAIITTTPGTVSCVIHEERREILVHALNCDDAQAMIDDMKARYEAPLMRIFRVSQSDVSRGGLV
ncbi:MAG: Na+/H+ antiporter subunit E [Burkholderiaceae bacterium]|nr:Na+/H+ antiporter subunit E [Burkholderiaceae bacterium]